MSDIFTSSGTTTGITFTTSTNAFTLTSSAVQFITPCEVCGATSAFAGMAKRHRKTWMCGSQNCTRYLDAIFQLQRMPDLGPRGEP